MSDVNKYCPMAQQAGCLGTKCMFFNEQEGLCMIIDGYLQNLMTGSLLGSVTYLFEKTDEYIAVLGVANAVELVSTAASSLRKLMYMIDRLLDRNDLSKHYRSKLRKIQKDIRLIVDSD